MTDEQSCQSLFLYSVLEEFMGFIVYLCVVEHRAQSKEYTLGQEKTTLFGIFMREYEIAFMAFVTNSVQVILDIKLQYAIVSDSK